MEIISSRIHSVFALTGCFARAGTNRKARRGFARGGEFEWNGSVLKKKQGQPILLADLVHVELIAGEVI